MPDNELEATQEPVSPAAPVADKTPAASSSDPAKAPAAKPVRVASMMDDPDEGTMAPKPVAGTWQEDWRELGKGALSADEAKLLDRFNSPADAFKALAQAQKVIASGKHKQAAKPGADATPAEIAAWRKSAGLPEAVEAYKPDLGQGVVPGEADQPMLKDFAKVAFETDMSQAAYSKAVNWYFDSVRKQDEARIEQDQKNTAAAREALRAEWGDDFKINTAQMHALVRSFPSDLHAEFAEARGPSGRRLFDNPAFINHLAMLQNDLNPAAKIAPAGAHNAGKSIADRVAEIKSWMASTEPATREKYYKNANVQKEYRDLIDAQQKMNQRAA